MYDKLLNKNIDNSTFTILVEHSVIQLCSRPQLKIELSTVIFKATNFEIVVNSV